MSSVPFYAIETSCRSAECPRSPYSYRAKPVPADATQGTADSPAQSPAVTTAKQHFFVLPLPRMRASSTSTCTAPQIPQAAREETLSIKSDIDIRSSSSMTTLESGNTTNLSKKQTSSFWNSWWPASK